MTERVLGPTGSPRRRWTLLLPLVAVCAVGLLYIAGAQAVHDAGLFELDTPSANATDNSANLPGPPPVTRPEDWDLICKANPGTCQFAATYTPPAGTTSATSSSHTNDGDLNATIFHGGGSKDPQPIADWLWKDGAGGLPDKDNLLHAYAARYSKPADATNCPSTTATCSVIYFGSDRFDNSGDATQAFWFLQNPIAANGAASQGGFQFTGNGHRDGDLLVISEFSNGGTTSTITVYQWTGDDATGSLTFLSGGANKSCDIVGTPDPFCGIVNTNVALTTAPWLFLDKSGNTNFAQGELYEAGINLSDPSIDLADECFSTMVAETRSSTSTTATLKDFVLAPFQQCQASMVTTPTSASVTPGTLVRDTAVVTGTGAATPPNPSSPANVRFFICEPGQLTPANTGVCSSGGTELLPTQALVHCTGVDLPVAGLCSGGADAQGVSRARSAAYDTTGKAPGRYCFRATWAGDSNYTAGASDSGANECFQVVRHESAIATEQWVYPNDKATVTSQGGATITGDVTFTLYDTNANCLAGGTTGQLRAPQTVTLAGTPKMAETTNTTTRVSSSSTVWWRAVYSGDALHFGRVTCAENTVVTFNNDAGPGTNVP